MRCLYCEVEVINYPESGICQHCGGRLPPKPEPIQLETQPVYTQPQQQVVFAAGDICPKCHSHETMRKARGFSWGLAIIGFFLLSLPGLLLGLCGKNSLRGHCNKCGHKWKI